MGSRRLIPRIFETQTVIVCASGPSLTGFDYSRLRDRNVIAINREHEVIPTAQVLWWSDARYWRGEIEGRKNRDSLLAHPAPYKATCQMDYRPDDDIPPEIIEYRFTGALGFDPDPRCLKHGNNGAYAAIHLAAHLGAKMIVLLGVDMRYSPDGRSHRHQGHGLVHTEQTLTQLMLPHFNTLAGPLSELGIEVLNASPDSALRTWPCVSIDEGLSID